MLRKLLLSSAAATAMLGSAMAADLPSRKAPPVAFVPPPVFTWTGFYIGGHVGYGWENVRERGFVTGVPFYDFRYNAQGVVGGGHVGFNWQVNQFVFGMEGDVDGNGIRRTVSNPFFFPFPTNVTTYRAGVGGSIRGRIGVAFDRALFYATGGVAFQDFRITNGYGFGLGIDGVYNTTRAGYTVGGGIEYAFTNNWLVRVEYRYSDYGTFNNASTIAPGLFYRERIRDNRVVGGLSYKFDWAAPAAPVVARY
jgi:outer membrane immunogenic protein